MAIMHHVRRQGAWIVFLLIFQFSHSTFAQEDRESPNYDGRESAAPTAGEVLIWVPRVAFFPVYLVTEYLIRQPLRAFGRAAEIGNFPAQVISFFTFGPQQRIGVFPKALIDFGLRPNAGVYFYWREFLDKRNRITINLATGGSDLYTFGLSDTFELSKKSRLNFNAFIDKRPDFPYYGTGGLTSKNDRSRYETITKEFDVSYAMDAFNTGEIRFTVGLRDLEFSDGECCGDPTLSSKVNDGSFSNPPGFDTGFTALRTRVDIAAGDRLVRPTQRYGGRATAFTEYAFELSDTHLKDWVYYGGSLTGFVELNGRFRVISINLDVAFTDSIGGGSLPFTELASLGGANPLPGFLNRRLVGQSAIAATLQYNWPIWSFFDGSVHFGVGNVYGEYLDGFRFGSLRKSVGVGIRAVVGSGSGFNLVAALGSEPFDRGGDFNEFRLLIGVSSAL